MERQNVAENARNMLTSKIGKALIDDTRFPSRLLELQKHQIEAEQRQQKGLMNNDERLFRHSSLIYNFEPTMVVERPGSPIKAPNQTSDGNLVPHYMTDLDKNQPHSYYNKPVIDAFRVRKKRKKNLWESDFTEKDLNEKFRSIVLNSPPLTSTEQYDLDKGWSLYRPISRMEQLQQKKLEDKLRKKQALAQTVRPRISQKTSAFITQLDTQAADEYLKKQRRTTLFSRLSESSKPRTSILIQQKDLRRINKHLDFDNEKLKKFVEMRDRQLSAHFKLINENGH